MLLDIKSSIEADSKGRESARGLAPNADTAKNRVWLCISDWSDATEALTQPRPVYIAFVPVLWG